MSTKEEASQNWLMFAKFWSCYNETQADPDKSNRTHINHIFANPSEEDDIYPLTEKEIAEAQNADITLKHLFKSNDVLDKGMELQLVENKSCISPLSSAPQAFPSRGDNECCDILERNEKHHPIHNKVMQDLPSEIKTFSTIWTSTIKNCDKHSMGCLCADLIGPCTPKGKDGSSIDFMALTMINPTSSWFEVVELPTIM
jgi:hypothetical protein